MTALDARSLLYRKRTEQGDMTMGEEPLSGLDAMREAIMTRIGELMGIWWEDGEDEETIRDYLSRPASDENRLQMELMIIDQIQSTVGVTGVYDVESAFLKDRSYNFSCRVGTVYGEITAEATL